MSSQVEQAIGEGASVLERVMAGIHAGREAISRGASEEAQRELLHAAGVLQGVLDAAAAQPQRGENQRLLALNEIASYNADELRDWGEENAADLVEIARRVVQPPYAPSFTWPADIDGDSTPDPAGRYTTEQARMRLRETLLTHELPEDGTADEYFIRAAFPDDPTNREEPTEGRPISNFDRLQGGGQ